MELDKQKIFDLMKEHSDGNYNRFARALGVDASHLHRFLNSGIGGGKKLIGAVMRFCRENDLDFENYIEIS